MDSLVPRLPRLWRLAPLTLALVAWESCARRSPNVKFLFGMPSLVASSLVADIFRGSLGLDISITAVETLCGLVLGSIVGTCAGLALWLSAEVARFARPYVLGVGAVPIFAIAPMTVIWFGTGLVAKVMMATLSTIFVAFAQAYEGARNVDSDLISLLKSLGASRTQTLSKVVFPSAVAWVIVSCRLNVGFAVLGAFMGEFISSDRGLGHYILKASGLYQVPRVLAGVLCIVALSLVLSWVISRVERLLMPWRFQPIVIEDKL